MRSLELQVGLTRVRMKESVCRCPSRAAPAATQIEAKTHPRKKCESSNCRRSELVLGLPRPRPSGLLTRRTVAVPPALMFAPSKPDFLGSKQETVLKKIMALGGPDF